MKCRKLERTKNFKLVEKSNHNNIHGIFGSKESGEQFLKEIVPLYIKNGYYCDKKLTIDSFEVIEK